MLATMFLVALGVFIAGYILYGRFMNRVYDLSDERKTPAEAQYDGIDYCPAHPAVLLGHHFASIAGAGPIVGPIAAAGLFGWLPVYLWCLVGSVFIGGPHDLSSIVASLRHQGKSIGEVITQWIGPRAKFLFLSFTWLSLVLVVGVFLELAAQTFARDCAVAFSGTLYIGLAVIFGLSRYRFRIPLLSATLVMLPIVLGAVWYGERAAWVQEAFTLPVNTWRLLLVVYVFLASVLPVWLLLQPRDYLASYLLYFAMIISSIGMVFGSGRFEVSLPAFKAFESSSGDYLWPILFVTVACGAVSGFHSMVASGTTSKQLRRETDARLVGYGSMLIEGLVAVVALGTVMMAGKVINNDPMETFGAGFGRFAELVGIDPATGKSLGLLAINSFILTTLDTATRLGRYQLQELTNMKLDRFTATAIGVAGSVAVIYVKTGDVPAWKVIWPVFGAANQLVAALVLLGLSVWVVKGLKKRATFLMIPMYFMLITTVAALVLLVKQNIVNKNYPLIVIGSLLLLMAVMLVKESFTALRRTEDTPASDPAR